MQTSCKLSPLVSMICLVQRVTSRARATAHEAPQRKQSKKKLFRVYEPNRGGHATCICLHSWGVEFHCPLAFCLPASRMLFACSMASAREPAALLDRVVPNGPALPFFRLTALFFFFVSVGGFQTCVPNARRAPAPLRAAAADSTANLRQADGEGASVSVSFVLSARWCW